MDKPNHIEESSIAAAASVDAGAATPRPAVGSAGVPNSDTPKAATPDIAAAGIAASKAEMAKIATAGIDAPKVEVMKLRESKPVIAGKAGPALDERVALATTAAVPARGNRFGLLAVSVVIAAGFGATAGALGTSGLARLAPSPAEAPTTAAPAAAEESRSLQTTIAQMRTDLAALKVSVEAGTRNSATQFTKLGERFDRIERAQGEPAAKFAKAVEALERLERRIDLAAAKETTGSVAPPHPAAAAPAPPQLPPPPPFVEGWVVRDVYRCVAVIQGRRMGMMEVETGDVVPGVGRIESIRKQNGRWVVLTSKGLITSSR